MNKPFAKLGFQLINRTEFAMSASVFAGGPWIHLATVRRREKEYCAIRHGSTGKVYLERIDNNTPGLFMKIESDAEWADLYRFLDENRIFSIDKPETVLGK
jgi:hypothetical protein